MAHGNSNSSNATDAEVTKEEINANHSNANISNITKLFSAQLKSKAKEGEIHEAVLKYYKPFENDLYLKGYVGFKIYVRELEEDWTDTFIAIGIGILTIYIGVGLMANPGFLGLIGKGLIFQGAGEIFQGLMAFAEGTPLSLDDFLKGKAIGLAVTVLTAGIAYIGAEVGWFNPETIYGKGVTDAAAAKATSASSIAVSEGITATAIIQNSFIFNVAGFLTGKAIDNYMKKNDGNIEEDIELEIQSLINNNKELLLEMLATDMWEMEIDISEKKEIFASLRQDAQNIMQKYVKTSTANQIGKEVVGSTINFGFGAIGGVMGGAFSAATNFVKAENAAESFASKFQHHINAKKDRVKTTLAMMREGLSRSYSEEEVASIAEAISSNDAGKYGSQINYQNCGSYDKLVIENKKQIEAVISNCERIAKIMQQAQNNQELEAFGKGLKGIMLSPIRKLYGDAAKPLLNLGVNELISWGMGKFNKPKAANDNEEQKPEEKAEDKEAEKLTKQEKEKYKNADIAKKMQEAEKIGRKQTEEVVRENEKRKAVREGLQKEQKLKEEAFKELKTYDDKQLKKLAKTLGLSTSDEKSTLEKFFSVINVINPFGARDAEAALPLLMAAGTAMEACILNPACVAFVNSVLIASGVTAVGLKLYEQKGSIIYTPIHENGNDIFYKKSKGNDNRVTSYTQSSVASGGMPDPDDFEPDEWKDSQKFQSTNQMNQEIQKGKAPKGLRRVDKGITFKEQDHVHFENGAALNRDGSWKESLTKITKEQAKWLEKNGWKLPKE